MFLLGSLLGVLQQSQNGNHSQKAADPQERVFSSRHSRGSLGLRIAAMFSLKVEVPGEESRRVALDKPVTTIGRSSFNDIVLADKSLSRRHARILRDGDGLSVEDLESRNGTYFNGERLTGARALSEGDRVTIGSCTL